MSALGKLKSLATGSGAIMASRLGGAGVGFLTQFLLVKIMGAHELGLFYAASSLAAVLGVIAAQGYPQIAARFVGRYRNKQDVELTSRFVSHALREGLFAAFIGALLVTVWAFYWPAIDPSDRSAYSVAGWMLISIVTLNIMTNIAGGMRDFVLCYMPEGLVRPILFFAVVGIAGLLGLRLSGFSAMMIFGIITCILAVLVLAVLAFRLKPGSWRSEPRRALGWRWRVEAWQLVLMAIFTNFFADVGILVAVPFLSNAETAVFGLCLKLALLVGYFVQIGQQMVVPDMADARHHRDSLRLRSAAWKSIKLPAALSLLSILVIYAFGEQLLSLFGEEFVSGRSALMILLAAQFMRSIAGPGVHLLTLTGIQKANMMIAVSSLLVLVAASAVLCPRLGVEGAAYAVLIVYVYWLSATAVALRLFGEQSVDLVSLMFGRREPRPVHAE
jgi:O-antigen/teichoic acid export membrane protein